MEYNQSEGMIGLMLFLNACFMEEVKNDPGIQKIHWYMSYELLEKSVVRFIMDLVHQSRGPEEY